MFKKLATLFSKKEEKLEIDMTPDPQPEPEPEPEPEPQPLPDVIEVPWPEAAPLKNLDGYFTKLNDDLKNFLFSSKLKERQFFEQIDKVLDTFSNKKKELEEAYGIPDNEYTLELPTAPGRSGFFKKKGHSNK